jgi:hypothetical protein
MRFEIAWILSPGSCSPHLTGKIFGVNKSFRARRDAQEFADQMNAVYVAGLDTETFYIVREVV